MAKRQSVPRDIVTLRALIGNEKWREALLLASSFPRLPVKARAAILSAREAYLRPDFQRQLGRDPAVLIGAGVSALVEAYRATAEDA